MPVQMCPKCMEIHKIANVFYFARTLTLQMKQQTYVKEIVLMDTLLILLQGHVLHYVLKVSMEIMSQMNVSQHVPLTQLLIMASRKLECVSYIVQMGHMLILTTIGNARLNALEILIHLQKIQLINVFIPA